MATSRRRDPRSGRGDLDPLDAKAARVSALDILSRRDRPAEELRRKLVEKGFDPAVAGEVIERLRHDKLVDDRRYAENFVAYHAARGHGPMRVRADLRKSGVDADCADEAIEAYPDWMAQLQKAHQKKFGAQQPTDYADEQRRARFLGYRGFTGAQIRMVLGLDTDLDIDM